jgi:hypothetical protein
VDEEHLMERVSGGGEGSMPWKNCRIIVILMVIFLATLGRGLVFSGPPTEGGILPDFYLPVPGEIQYKRYLGLDDQSMFKIPEIKTDVVIIQIFSMY